MRGNRGGRQGELLLTAVIALYSEIGGRRREGERERARGGQCVQERVRAGGYKQSNTQRKEEEREGARERK